MDARTALLALGGVARTAALLRAGVREREIAAAVEVGTYRRVRQGLLALPDAEPALVVAAHLGGTLTCVSALSRSGVGLLRRSNTPHVAVRAHFSRGSRDVDKVRVHYGQPAVTTADHGWIAGIARALDDAGRCLDPRAHLVAVDSALHLGLVRPDQVAGFTVTSRERRHWLLAHMDARSESVGETLARLDCAQAGLAVHPQRFITGVGRVDMVVEDRVIVEIDGRAFHDDPEAFRRDRRRDRRVTQAHMPVLRFAHGELTDPHPPNVASEVQALLDGGP